MEYIFSHERAGVLDDPEREGWLPTAAIVELLDVPSGSRVVAYNVQPEMLDIVRRRTADLRLENFSAAST